MKSSYWKKWLTVLIICLMMLVSIPIAMGGEENNDAPMTYESAGKHVVSLSGGCSSFSFNIFSLHVGRLWWMILGQSIGFRVEEELVLKIDGEIWELECPVFISFTGFKGFAPGLLWWSVNHRIRDDNIIPVRVNGICDSIYIHQDDD